MTVARARYKAIQQVLEGKLGTTGRLAPEKFFRRVFEGQPTATKQAQTLDAHGFDIQMRGPSDHPATPVSALTLQPIQSIAITIPIWTHVASPAELEAREEVLARIMTDGEEAAAALGYPRNLATDVDGNATQLVGGLMFGPNYTGTPDFEIVAEDWGNRLIRSQITGSLILSPSV